MNRLELIKELVERVEQLQLDADRLHDLGHDDLVEHARAAAVSLNRVIGALVTQKQRVAEAS